MEWKNLTAWIRARYSLILLLLQVCLTFGLPLTGVPRVWVYAICTATGFLVGIVLSFTSFRAVREHDTRPPFDPLTPCMVFLLLTSGYLQGIPKFSQANNAFSLMLDAVFYSSLGTMLSLTCYFALILFTQRRIIAILLIAAPALGILTAPWPFVPSVVGLLFGLAIIRLAPPYPAPQVLKPEIQTLLQWLLPFTGAVWILQSLLDQRHPLSHSPRIAAYATLVAMTGIILIIRPLQSRTVRNLAAGEQPGA